MCANHSAHLPLLPNVTEAQFLAKASRDWPFPGSPPCPGDPAALWAKFLPFTAAAAADGKKDRPSPWAEEGAGRAAPWRSGT